MLLKLGLLASVLLCGGLANKKAHVRYQWKIPEFVFPSESVKKDMISSDKYIPGNPFMLDVDVWNKGAEQKVFVTTPRFKPGIPATLSVLSTKTGQAVEPSSPLLEPYPSWAWNRQGNCHAMTSVFRIQVDPCGRMWVIDSGVVDLMTDRQHICPPQVLVFDLRTNKLLTHYRIPQKSLKDGSLLINIAVDVQSSDGSCRDTFAYIADVTEHGLIVFDSKSSKSWRVTSSLFVPQPSASHFTVAGESFDLGDGLFGLALGPLENGDRTLYFHSLANFHELWVKTSVLRNPSLFLNGTNTAAGLFHESPGTRPSQTAATAMSKDGILFFNLLSNNSLGCWNSREPYTAANLVQLVQDDDALQFVSGMKIVRDTQRGEMLWALSCRFQKVMTGSFDTSEVNFRVVMAPVAQIVKGTTCHVRHK